MVGIQSLFDQDLIFFENVSSQQELFRSIGNQLLAKKLVNPGYIEAIIEREQNFPTGLDLSVIRSDSPNVAIPHTEVEYCNWKGIVVVRLEQPIMFCSMIAPDKKILVSDAFFILNNEKNSQTNLLSYLMDFFTSKDKLSKLDKLENKSAIYQLISE